VSYAPYAGSLADRMIKHLQALPKDAEVSSAQLAEAMDSDASLVTMALKQAVDAGFVKNRTRPENKRLLWWSVGDGVPPAREPEVLPHRNIAPEVKPRAGEMLPGVRGDEPVPKHDGRPMTLAECAAAEEKPRQAGAFDCWLSGVTGELMLQGVHVDPEGDVILSGEQAAVVRRVLQGAPA
jgi:DNA-binding transcriptional MocR family regulator